MKTFKDLVFEPHAVAKEAEGLPITIKNYYANAKQAVMNFENSYGVSVLFGACFYSNGIDTYELAVLKDGNLCYSTEITSDVLGGITEDEVSEIMVKVQQL